MAHNNDNQAVILEEALTRFVDECLQGRQPDIDDFVKQYPQCEAQLKLRLQDLEQIDSMFDSLVRADEIDFEDAAAVHSLVGRKFGSFEVLKMIGRGGTGVVHLARDTRLGRSVAIKSVSPKLVSDSTTRTRLRREAKLLASLNHPNIAAIHDIIEQDDSTDYLILEYVPGQTLAQHIGHKPLKFKEALSIGLQIADAVSAAHEKGIVHRDLKPGNIKITSEGKVKVLDFGLGKVDIGEGAGGDITATQSGHVIGTPAYMSPEQSRGESIDHLTDIWSFGCIMYEMLTGQLPFEGETATATLARIIERQPDWEALPQETPMNIRTLLRRCLEKNPQQRLRDIGDAVIEIKETLKMPVAAPPVTMPSSTLSKPQTTTRKELRAVTIVIAVLSIILSVVAVKFVFYKDVSVSLKEIRLVILPFENLGSAEDEYFADGITEAITARLAGIHGLSVISRQSAIQYKASKKDTKQIAEELGVDYILEGTVQRELPAETTGRVRIIPQLIKAFEDSNVWTEIYDDDMSKIFRLQSDVAERVAQALDIAVIEPERRALSSKPTENMEAYEYYLQGNSYFSGGCSEHDTRIAIRMFERAVELDPGFALAYANLCGTHGHMYNLYDHSQERIAMAKQAVDKALEIDPDLPEVHYALGTYYERIGDGERALEQFAIVRKSRPNHTGAIKMAGYTLRWMGKLEQAVNNFKRVLELNPRDIQLLNHVGYTLKCIRKYAEAERYHDRAISLAPDESLSYLGKAWLYMSWKGDTDKARGVLANALQNIESTENPFVDSFADLDVFDRDYQGALDKLSSKQQDIDNLEDLLKFGQIYRYMDKKELAKKYYDEARSVLEAEIQQYPEDARYHGSLGIAYAGLGRKEDAITEENLAIKLDSNHAVKYPYRIEELARIYVMVGEHDEAIDQLEHLLSTPGPFSIHFLKLDPVWDPLRNHPRFQELIAQSK